LIKQTGGRKALLAISFFTLIFSSLVWIIVSVHIVSDNLGATPFLNAGIADICLYLAIICLPVFLAWLVFGYACQYLQNRKTDTMLFKLFNQMKKNQDYSDLLARIMIETEQQVKDGFMLNRFDLLIADMNELLAEIIQDCKIASAEQIERLWNKVRNGSKWAFGKVVIEVNNAQPNFQMRVYEKANRDLMLGGTIMEFCARYQSVVSLLEKHDHDKVFLNIIETGVMGKTFSIFAPISDEIRRSRESMSFSPRPQPAQPVKAEESVHSFKVPHPLQDDAPQAMTQAAAKNKLLEKVPFFKKKESTPDFDTEKDPFSQALERSFGKESVDEASSPAFEEPKFEIAIPDEEPEPFHTLQTQQQLDNLKKEWETLTPPVQVPAPQSSDDDSDDFSYPFGGWTDEQNYNK